ncbi:DNA mismatch repair ATPase msh1, partial [Cymbomonas tetramitiformis]
MMRSLQRVVVCGSRLQLGPAQTLLWKTVLRKRNFTGGFLRSTYDSPRHRRLGSLVLATDAALRGGEASSGRRNLSRTSSLRNYDKEYWAREMDKVERPAARNLLARLDFTDPLGVNFELKGAAKGKNTLYDFVTTVKRLHPRKVVLLQVGDFFEAMGYDAVMLVQYCSLNPMGTTGVPRAGCPLQNLRRTLDDLTSSGFSVAVCQEAPEAYGARPKRKTRFVSGIVTPASPEYIHDLVHSAHEPGFTEQRRIVGLSATVRGYCMAFVDPDTRLCTLTDGLTSEAVLSRLQAGGCAEPVYVHASVRHLQEGRQRWEQGALGTALASMTKVAYAGPRPAERLLELIRLDLSMDPSTSFKVAAPLPPPCRCQEGTEADVCARNGSHVPQSACSSPRSPSYAVTKASTSSRPRALYLETAKNM